ncbi:MAG: hypothetical protein K2O16_12540 [Lachnospiraceae bacterium]|nr:hypothetical protein [Lachnospiraceae bacterium]MDE7333037.1 hypothetical protein [Lachnospiraceae bacterium]
MNKNETFCEECSDDVAYIVSTVPMAGTIKGGEYCYTGKEAYCAECGSPVFVPELNKGNLKSALAYEKSRRAVAALLSGMGTWTCIQGYLF